VLRCRPPSGLALLALGGRSGRAVDSRIKRLRKCRFQGTW
jgi:hypothetical protein